MYTRLCIWMLMICGMCISCIEYTPKPRGYFRIEPPVPVYQSLPDLHLPYTFQISHLTEVKFPSAENLGWINIIYPQLRVKLYCSYLPISSKNLVEIKNESHRLVLQQTKYPHQIVVKEYNDPDSEVYGCLFMLGNESASPIQFMLTDSVSHFFRGVLYYDCMINADSLEPVTQYLKQDIIELIQSFKWKK